MIFSARVRKSTVNRFRGTDDHDQGPAGWPAQVRVHHPRGFAAVDVETTGLVAHRDRVVQVAVALIGPDGTVEHTWSTLVDPECDPGPVHGITRDRLLHAPVFHDVAEEVGSLTAGRTLVAHNAPFDWGFLDHEMRRVGRTLAVEDRLCTQALARRLDLPVVNLKLSTIAAYWGITQRRAHDAEDDTRVLVEIFRRQLVLAEELGLALPLTPCRVADRRIAAPRPDRPVRPPRTDCPWQLPPAWRAGVPLVQGHRFVVTGATNGDRADLYRRAVAAGLDARNGVSRVTSFVVTNEPSGQTRKMRDARAVGIPSVSEVEFERLLRDVRPGVPRGPAVTPPVVPAAAARTAQPRGPFSRRRVLVLGGPHDAAAAVREGVVARGGIAAVNLTVTTTDYVALDGATHDPRWGRVQERGLRRIDPKTWDGVDIEAASLVAPPSATGSAVAPEVVVLPRGGTTDLPGSARWVLEASWSPLGFEVDVVALRLGDDDLVAGDEDLVFFGAPATADGSVRVATDIPGEAEVSLAPDLLPPDVDRVLVAAALPDGVTFGDIGAVEIVLRSADGAVFARATLDAGTTERSLVLGQVYRRGITWRFRAQGQGYDTGLRELVERHGVDVED